MRMNLPKYQTHCKIHDNFLKKQFEIKTEKKKMCLSIARDLSKVYNSSHSSCTDKIILKFNHYFLALQQISKF